MMTFRHPVPNPAPGAEREGGLAPLSKIPVAARNAVFRSMLKSGLLTEVPAPEEHARLGWRQDEASAWIALRITDKGLTLIGLDPAGSVPVPAPSDYEAPTSSDSASLVACPLSNALRQRRRLANGGSGALGFEVRRRVAGGSSGAVGWSAA
jgi:hypothetical protein